MGIEWGFTWDFTWGSKFGDMDRMVVEWVVVLDVNGIHGMDCLICKCVFLRTKPVGLQMMQKGLDLWSGRWRSKRVTFASIYPTLR